MLDHAALAVRYKGERIAMQEMRKQIGWYVKGLPRAAALRRERVKLERERRREEAQRKRERQNLAYKDDDFKVVPLDRQRMRDLIARDLTLPEIAQAMPEYSYEQLYDTVLCDEEYNRLYRQHGQLRFFRYDAHHSVS